MEKFLANHAASLDKSVSPQSINSPAKLIEAFAGDNDFMTSLARGLAVIHAFQERKRHLTVSQISHRTEIPRASVRRCLQTLIKLGYVNSDRRSYYLTPKMLKLSHAYLSSTQLALTAQPILDRLIEDLHQSFSLATLDGDHIIYISRSATPLRLISLDISAGTQLPAYCTSMGRVLLAALEDEKLQDYLERAHLKAMTSRTIHHRSELNTCLHQIRKQGYAIVDQEMEIGLRSLAVPLKNTAGQVLAAINIGVDARRVSLRNLEENFLSILQGASKELSHRLFQNGNR